MRYFREFVLWDCVYFGEKRRMDYFQFDWGRDAQDRKHLGMGYDRKGDQVLGEPGVSHNREDRETYLTEGKRDRVGGP